VEKITAEAQVPGLSKKDLEIAFDRTARAAYCHHTNSTGASGAGNRATANALPPAAGARPHQTRHQRTPEQPPSPLGGDTRPRFRYKGTTDGGTGSKTDSRETGPHGTRKLDTAEQENGTAKT